MRPAAVVLLLLSAGLAYAEGPQPPPPYGKALGVGAGAILSSHAGTEPWITANIRLRLRDHFILEPDAAFWSREPDRNDTLSHVLSFGVNAVFTTGGSPVSVWGGAGVGVQLLRYAGIIAYEPFIDAYPTLALLAGVDYRVSRKLTLYGAARADFSWRDDPNGTKFYAGIRLHL